MFKVQGSRQTVIRWDSYNHPVGLCIGALYLAALLFILNSTALGCSCSGSRLAPADQSLKNSENVFVVKLTSLIELDVRKAKATANIVKVYKGNLKKGTQVRFMSRGLGGAGCQWFFRKFEIGKEFLFYRNEFDESKPILNSICRKEGSVEKYASDIAFLEKLDQKRGVSRIAGIVRKGDYYLSESTPVVGHKIRLVGEGFEETIFTDSKGVFEVYGLPPGKYFLSSDGIEGYKARLGAKGGFEVQVEKNRHTESNINFKVDNVISGRVIDPSGKGIKGVCLRLIPVSKSKSLQHRNSDCTDGSGGFRFESIGADSYVLAVNTSKLPNRIPFKKFYYPSAENPEAATIINISPGISLENLLITPPKMYETIIVSGRVLFEDGKPAAGIHVGYYVEKDGNIPEWSNFGTSTNKNGEFSIEVIKGTKGVISSSKHFGYVGKYKHCKELYKIIENEPYEVRTPVFQVSGYKDVSGVTLRFPFPKCDLLNK